MANTFGNIWTNGDTGTVQRGNRKSLSQLTGAEIDALFFDTNLTSQYVFAGNANDSVASNNLTENGSPTYDADGGPDGQFIILNGSSQYLTASANTVHDITTGDFSITGWIYRSSDSGGVEILCIKQDTGATNNKGYGFFINGSDKLVARICDGSATQLEATGATSIATGTWYFVAAVFDRDGNATVYLNATSDGSTAISTQQLTITNTQTFTVGRLSVGAGNYFPGRIDDLRIWARALSATEVKVVMNDCRGGMKVLCTETSSPFTKGLYYFRNAENSAWLEEVERTTAQELTNKTLNASVAKGTWTASGTWTTPAFTLGGTVTATNQEITNAQLVNPVMKTYGRQHIYINNVDSIATSVSGTAAIANEGGLGIKISSGATSGSVARFSFGTSTQGVLFRRDRKWEYHILVTSDTTGNYELEFGLTDGTTTTALQGDNQHYAVFQYNTAVSTNWYTRCNDGGATAPAAIDTGTALTANSATLLSIINDESTIKFYINGTLEETWSTDLPGATTSLFLRGYQKNTAAADKITRVVSNEVWSDVA